VDPIRQKKRLSPKDIERVLLQLCQNRWLTRNQIAQLLDRNSEGLRQRFLNPMVEHGLLRLRYPKKPNRTDQAYSAVKEN
jgi:ATP-dependent DNA helicase RecG